MDIKKHQYLKLHFQKNATHDDERASAQSMVKNMFFTKDIVDTNPYFKHKQIDLPMTKYLDSDRRDMQQLAEKYNPDKSLFKLSIPPHLSQERKEIYQYILPEKYHAAYLEHQNYLLELDIKYDDRTPEERELEEQRELERRKIEEKNREIGMMKHYLLSDKTRLHEYKQLNRKMKQRKKIKKQKEIDLLNEQLRQQEMLELDQELLDINKEEGTYNDSSPFN